MEGEGECGGGEEVGGPAGGPQATDVGDGGGEGDARGAGPGAAPPLLPRAQLPEVQPRHRGGLLRDLASPVLRGPSSAVEPPASLQVLTMNEEDKVDHLYIVL